MGAEKDQDRALNLVQRAISLQMAGDLEESIRLYKESISLCPTADAYTYLGWAYSYQGKIEEAIAQCEIAIRLDPEFGNPYNDIGAYLIEKGEYDQAIPWLERALQSRRYDTYHFPHFNLGRLYLAKELYSKARVHFEQALKSSPEYAPAQEMLEKARLKLQ